MIQAFQPNNLGKQNKRKWKKKKKQGEIDNNKRITKTCILYLISDFKCKFLEKIIQWIEKSLRQLKKNK